MPEEIPDNVVWPEERISKEIGDLVSMLTLFDYTIVESSEKETGRKVALLVFSIPSPEGGRYISVFAELLPPGNEERFTISDLGRKVSVSDVAAAYEKTQASRIEHDLRN